MPTAVTAPSGEITVTESPGNTPRLRASSRPSKMGGAPAARCSVRACARVGPPPRGAAGRPRAAPADRPAARPAVRRREERLLVDEGRGRVDAADRLDAAGHLVGIGEPLRARLEDQE